MYYTIALYSWLVGVSFARGEDDDDDDCNGEEAEKLDTANPDCTYRLEMMSAQVSFALLECTSCCSRCCCDMGSMTADGLGLKKKGTEMRFATPGACTTRWMVF